MSKREVIGYTVAILVIIAGFIYAAWQFDLCYPEVGGFWYCFQHAFG